MTEELLSVEERNAKRAALAAYMQVVEDIDGARTEYEQSIEALNQAQERVNQAEGDLETYRDLIQEAVDVLGSDPLDYLHYFTAQNGVPVPDVEVDLTKVVAGIKAVNESIAKTFGSELEQKLYTTPTGTVMDERERPGLVVEQAAPPLGVSAHGHQRYHKRGEAREKVLAALPGTVHRIVETTGIKEPVVRATITSLQQQGLVVKNGSEKGRGGLKQYIYDHARKG